MKRIALLSCLVLISCEKNGPADFVYSIRVVSFAAGKRYTYEWMYEARDSLGNILATLNDDCCDC